MPTERFYRLPEEKKQLICGAAVKEFARVPVDKVSINRIIKDAEISRGSFYTYFDDKWDLLECIFEESQNRLREFCRDALGNSGGDIWYMLRALLEKMIEFCSGTEQFAFIKSVMSHAGSDEIIRGFSQKMNNARDRKSDEIEHWIYENTNQQLLSITEYQEFHSFFQIAMFCLAIELKDYFNEVPLEVIRERFTIKMEILKHGICKSETEGRAGES